MESPVSHDPISLRKLHSKTTHFIDDSCYTNLPCSRSSLLSPPAQSVWVAFCSACLVADTIPRTASLGPRSTHAS